MAMVVLNAPEVDAMAHLQSDTRAIHATTGRLQNSLDRYRCLIIWLLDQGSNLGPAD